MFRRFGSPRSVGSVVPSSTTPVPPANTPEVILGSNLAEIWYAEDAVQSGAPFFEVSSVTGRLQNIVMFPGFNAPVYEPADSGLRNQPSIKCQDSSGDNALFLSTDVLAESVVPAGNRPFMWCVGRNRTLTSGTNELFGSATFSAWSNQVIRLGATDQFSRLITDGAYDSASPDAPSTSATIIGCGATSTDVVYYVDGEISSTGVLAPDTSLPSPLGVITVGIGNNGNPSNWNAAVWGICKNLPTSEQLTQLYEWAVGIYWII